MSAFTPTFFLPFARLHADILSPNPSDLIAGLSAPLTALAPRTTLPFALNSTQGHLPAKESTPREKNHPLCSGCFGDPLRGIAIADARAPRPKPCACTRAPRPAHRFPHRRPAPRLARRPAQGAQRSLPRLLG